MNREHNLTILYDLALALSSEVRLRPLLTRVLQHLLYHTSFPAGLVLLDLPDGEGDLELPLTLAIGSAELATRVDTLVTLPGALLRGPPALITNCALIDRLPMGQTRYRVCLRLPVPDTGVILLLAPELPARDLPLIELFQPVMANLAKAVQLCRANEAHTRAVESDRDLAREQLARQLQRSDRERRFLRSLYDAIPDLIWIKDAEGVFLACNSKVERLFGFPEAQIVGKTDYDFVPRQLADFFRAHDLKATAADGPSANEEWLSFAADGYHGLFETIKTPVRDVDGRLIGVLGIARDITERERVAKELERHRSHLEEMVAARTAELAEARDAAEAASRAKSTFLAKMSHEIRTPMNAIIGFTQLLRVGASDPRQLDYLDKVADAARHLMDLINDILDLSKIEAGRMTLHETDMDLVEVLADIDSQLGDLARAKGLALALDVDPSIPRLLRGDPLRLRQVLLNFVDNAVKFTDRGSVSVRVHRLGEDAEGVYLRFEVEDTGIGIDLEQQERLFQVFEQADGSVTRRYGGTGLGLAISKRLVHLMGGELGVKSAPGVGSTFWLRMHLRSAADHPAMSPAAPPRADFARLRVLLAEDDPLSQELARVALATLGLRVDTADDGAQALAMVEEGNYDLVVMDVQMPKMDGLEATRRIRALGGVNGTLPILALTADAFDNDRRACLAAGMDGYLSKPVDLRQLQAALVRYLPLRP